MDKIYISANELLADSFRLAAKIYDSGFRPDLIIGVWRGGAPVGIAVHEYLDYLGVSTDHFAIRTSSYTGINQQNKKVEVHGLSEVLERLTAELEVLIIDDVFDSGRSITTILAEIAEKAGDRQPKTLKIACPWYKPHKNVTKIQPDFYLHESDSWLVFPHELKGLTLEEIENNKGELADTMRPKRLAEKADL